MIKKILITTILFSVILGTFCFCLAEEKNIQLNLGGTTTIEKGTEKVELILSLGSFTGIEEDVPLGYQAQLVYDNSMFSSVQVEGLNGWSGDYQNNIITGDIAKAKSNVNIAKITLTIKEGLTVGTQGKVNLNEIILTAGEEDTFNLEKEITIKIVEPEPEPDPDPEPNPDPNPDPAPEQEKENENKQPVVTQKENKQDKTTSAKKLPAAGNENKIAILVISLVSIGIISYIRYKSIKLK